MTTLKPCPFCGGEAQQFSDDETGNNPNIHCGNDDCTAWPVIYAGSGEDAVKAWQTRPAEDALTDAVSDLVGLVRQLCHDNNADLHGDDLKRFDEARLHLMGEQL